VYSVTETLKGEGVTYAPGTCNLLGHPDYTIAGVGTTDGHELDFSEEGDVFTAQGNTLQGTLIDYSYPGKVTFSATRGG
jgi:hypothetical protein